MSGILKVASAEHQGKQAVFDEYARYYDLLYRDKDYELETDYVTPLIRQFHPHARMVLELGSGTGIHAMHLTKRGFEVTGIEISAEMIQIAQQRVSNSPVVDSKSQNPLFHHGDIRTVRLNRTYDAVIALFHVMSYQITNADISAAFVTAREHLDPKGVFLFDVWYGPAVFTERPSVKIKHMVDERTRVTRIAEPVMRPNENLVDVYYHMFVEDLETGTIKQLKETHTMRYYFKPEIEAIAGMNGLQIINTEEWLSGKPIGANTWGACFILQAV